MRYTQPQSGPIRVDRSNPYGKIATLLVLPSDGDLITGKGVSFYGAAKQSIGPVGKTVSSPGATADGALVAIGGSSAVYNATNQLSLFFQLNISAFAGSTAAIISFPYNAGAWLNPYGSFYLFQNSSGGGSLNLLYSVSNVFYNVPIGVVLSLGQHDYGLTLDTGVITCYRDGVQVASVGTGTTGNIDWGSKNPLNLFNRASTSTGESGAGDLSLLYMTNSALQAKDHLNLHNAPWQLFADDDTDWLRAAGATSPTAALAWLEQNDATSIAATVAAPLTASLSWAEANDTTALSATVTNASQLSWAEANDTSAITARVVGVAALAWTEANDSTSITANVNTGGAVLNWTEANDTTAISATAANSSTLAWAEANDVTVITASVPQTVTGTISWAEQNDTCAIIAAAVVNGGLAWTEQSDVTSITTAFAQTVSATLAWSEQSDMPAVGTFNEYFFTIMRQSVINNTGSMSNAPINRIGTFV